MINPELLEKLRCPETRQKLLLADESLIASLNQGIARGEITNRAARRVTEKLDAGLIREDETVIYPVHGNLPIMLIDEAIPLAGNVGK